MSRRPEMATVVRWLKFGGASAREKPGTMCVRLGTKRWDEMQRSFRGSQVIGNTIDMLMNLRQRHFPKVTGEP